jgi:squalene-associated FAD-dependent desaturase
MKPVIIIGGGPAGIAAACALADRGRKTILLERSARLGGRAASFIYAAMNEEIDYGQHVLMRCCTASIDLLHQLGIERAVSFQERLEIPLACGSERSLLTSSPLPGPLHLLPSLMRYRAISYRERTAVLRASLSLLIRDPQEERTFADWLRRHGQRESVITRLWEPVSIATLNERSPAVSARAARKVFKDGFFRPGGANMGFFTLPLSRIFVAAVPFLSARGGEVRLNAAVQRVLVEKGRVKGIELATGERIEANEVIAAIPPFDLLPILPEAIAGEGFFRCIEKMRFSPIVNLHLWFDRPVMEELFLIAVDSPLQAIFDLTRIQRREGPNHIVLSQSAAREWVDLPVTSIKEQLLSALSALLPTVRKARLLDGLVIKSKRATFIPSPRSEPLRPGPQGPIKGLILAGDYTQTGWPSTIEGAVRSGRNAAIHVR